MRRVPPYAFGLVVLLAAWPAHAQTGQTGQTLRPYRGLFASTGTPDEETPDEMLVVRGTLSGGYDGSILASIRGTEASLSEPPVAGGLGRAMGSLLFDVDRDRVQVVASAGGSEQYYPTLSTPWITRKNANGLVVVRLPAGFTVEANGGYRPYTLESLFPSVADQAGPALDAQEMDVAVRPVQFVTYGGGGTFEHGLSRRSELDLSYIYRGSNSLDTNGRFETQSAAGSYIYHVSQGLDVRAGYGEIRTRYDYPQAARLIVNHAIDAGINYNRPLSFSRRTTLYLSTGSAVLSYANQTRFYGIGDARLTHDIGRTWEASINYGRHVTYVDTWDQPLFADAVTATYGGLVNQRVQFYSFARAAIGAVGFTASNRNFHAYYGGTGLLIGLTRHLGLEMDYAYSHQSFAETVVPPTGWPQHVSRNRALISITAWVPLFQHQRRSNAAR